MSLWYDPITETWYKMPTQPEPLVVVEPAEDIYQRAERLNRINRIWDAVIDVSSQ